MILFSIIITSCFWLRSYSLFGIPFLPFSLLDVISNNRHLFFLTTVLPSVNDSVSNSLFTWYYFRYSSLDVFWLRSYSLFKIPFLTLPSIDVISKHHDLFFLTSVVPSVYDSVSWLSLHVILFLVIITWCFGHRSYSQFKILFLTFSTLEVFSTHHSSLVFFWLRSYPLLNTPFLNSLFTWCYFQLSSLDVSDTHLTPCLRFHS